MTNNEILKADILDILFEKRNKDYGAYVLRRGYDKRLLTALSAALVAILIVVFMLTSGRKSKLSNVPGKKKDVVELTEIIIPKEKPKEPEPPKEQPKQKEQPKKVEKVAKEKFTSKIQIKPDDQVKKTMPDVTTLDDKKISDTKVIGKPDDGVAKKTGDTVATGNGNVVEKTQPVVDFRPDERSPEFPGGPEALRRFMASNLQSPSDLENGEKKVVLIKFKVDKDGTVNTFEILTSGGNEFDREVVRVCKKMPRWTPAIQNGINVPVSYMLPVTFIGVEQ